MSKETNSDGLIQNYGTRDAENGIVRRVGDAGGIQQLVAHFTYDALPGFDEDAGGGATPDSFGDVQAFMPAYSYIKSATLVVKSDFTGGTIDLNIGLYQKDGTVIDLDGIDDGIAEAALDTGDVVVCDGALCGAGLSIGAADGYIVVNDVGAAMTAGEATLVVEYIAPRG